MGSWCLRVVRVFAFASIFFVSGHFSDATGAPATVVLKHGTTEVDKPIRITRNTVLRGLRGSVLSGGGITRLIEVSPGVTLRIQNVTLANGLSTNGGAIFNNGGTVIAINCVFSNNVARGIDGTNGGRGTNGIVGGPPAYEYTPGEPGGAASAGLPAFGGAIFSTGSLFLSHCVFLRNVARGGIGGNGGDGGDAAVWGVPGDGGHGANGAEARGGAIFAEGSLSSFNTHFVMNSAYGGGGGIGGIPGTNTWQSYGVRTPGESGEAGNSSGGALYVTGTAMIKSCSFSGNVAIGSEGMRGRSIEFTYAPATGFNGALGRQGTDGGTAAGGAIFASGLLELLSSSFDSNSAVGASGGKGGEGGSGHSTMGGYGGGGSNGGDAGNGGSAFGGAVCSADSISISNCWFTRCTALSGDGGVGGAGGWSARDGWQRPRGGLGGTGGSAEGGAVSHYGKLNARAVASFHCMAIAGAGGQGGRFGGFNGITSFAGSFGVSGVSGTARGGGLFANGSNHIVRSQWLFNAAIGPNGTNGSLDGGSNWKYDPPSGQSGSAGGHAYGGGMFVVGATLFDSCTAASNRCVAGHGGAGSNGTRSMAHPSSGGSGGSGGSALGAGVFSSGTFYQLNSTVAFNVAQAGNGATGGNSHNVYTGSPHAIRPSGNGGDGGTVFGAGIAMNAGSTAWISFSTIAGNQGTYGLPGMAGGTGTNHAVDGVIGNFAGAAIGADASFLVLDNTIVANTVSNAFSIAGPVDDRGYNLCADAGCGFSAASSRQSVDPLLDSLRDNGGPTYTVALLPGSPAIDSAGVSMATDQRGYVRPAGSSPDIGAFEADATPVISVTRLDTEKPRSHLRRGFWLAKGSR